MDACVTDHNWDALTDGEREMLNEAIIDERDVRDGYQVRVQYHDSAEPAHICSVPVWCAAGLIKQRAAARLEDRLSAFLESREGRAMLGVANRRRLLAAMRGSSS